jgi:hypothetical protein
MTTLWPLLVCRGQSFWWNITVLCFGEWPCATYCLTGAKRESYAQEADKPRSFVDVTTVFLASGL